MPVFSIVIPTFNAGKVIKRCLSSVLNQSFTDYEIIIQDGGSSDNTLQIVNSCQENYNGAKLLWHLEKDRGVYDAMNKGVEKAKGTFVYFLGSDDELYDTEVLRIVYEFSKQYDSPDIIYGNVTSSVLGNKYDGEFSLEKLFTRNICHQAIFYKRSLFNRMGGYKVHLNVLGDYEYNIRCFLNKDITIKYIDKTIAYFNDGGLSSSISEKEHIWQRLQIMRTYAWGVIPEKRIKRDYSSAFLYYTDLIKFKLGIKPVK